MSRFQDLEDLFRRRLLAAAHRDYVDQTSPTSYEEELHRQRKLLDGILTPEIKLQRSEFPADVQQPLVGKGEDPEQQDGPIQDEEGIKSLYIKEEPEELWSSQEGERLRGPDETAAARFPLPPVLLKSEDDEDIPQSSKLHQKQNEQMGTEADGKDCGASGPARNSDSDSLLQAEIEVEIEQTSEAETDDSDDWRDTTEQHLRLNSVENTKNRKSKTDEKHQRCRLCGKPSKVMQRPNKGMRNHMRQKPYSCSECVTMPRLKNLRTRHMGGPRVRRCFCCIKCGKRFTQKCILTKGMEIDGGNKCICPQCRSKCRQKCGPTSYARINTVEKPLSCPECGKRFQVKSNLTAHMAYHNRKKLSCSECGLRCIYEGRLTEHMRIHTGEKPFSCSECGKRFTCKDILMIHMRIHTGEEPFSCSLCRKRFNQEVTLTQHSRVHMEGRCFSCPWCAKSFSQKRYLTAHVKIHTGEKQFSCSVCRKKFNRRSKLTAHMVQHGKEKPVSCSECHKKFFYQSRLTDHMRTHMEEEPFKCADCEKRFKHKRNMIRHMRIHTGEKPFSCNGCDKSFHQKAHLMKHIVIHTRK